ncbi:basic leucine zipper 23-like [Papaver somniferum]|uniref:basic leucine zipper 23-like n=1 Tax=Papaver somniferum TaxID=3469 RepID=UPI000E6FE742|nr:basic leucine zipper 23-like [Papaver somniferum]
MDDGEVEFSNQLLNMDNELPSSRCFFQGDAHASTHTHICNPPGPDSSHSHTCIRTKIRPVPTGDKVSTDDTAESAETKSKKRPSGNREAVRKYREKKKAREASLEDEVVRLRAINQQLMPRLQGQAALEAEVARLKCLLVDIRGRIEGEIGSFPYRKPTKSIHGTPRIIPPSNLLGVYEMNNCDLWCDDKTYCTHPGLDNVVTQEIGVLNNKGCGPCDVRYGQCVGNTNISNEELPDCGQTKGILGTPQNMPPSNLLEANLCDLRCDNQVDCMHPGLDYVGTDGLDNVGTGETGGEVDCASPHWNMNDCSMDFLNEFPFLRDNNAYTHTHICNPAGPDSSHTHTCIRSHTKVLPAPTGDKVVWCNPAMPAVELD